MDNIIIIGGGVSGLSAGIFAQKAGFKCRIFEKNSDVGGALAAWERNGFLIDGCIHWLTGTNKNTELFDIWKTLNVCDGENTVYTEYFYKSEFENESISFYPDADKTKEEMLKSSPVDKAEINRFFNAVKAAQSLSNKQIDGAYSNLKCYAILSRYIPLNLEKLSQKFHSPLLKRAFTDYIDGEFSSLGLILAYGAYSSQNAGFPIGGSGETAKRMSEEFLSCGGEIYLNSEVEKIVLNGNKADGILLKDGSFFECDYIICATHPKLTFEKFLNKKMPAVYINHGNNKKKYPTFSSLHFAFSVDANTVPFKSTVVFECESIFYDEKEKTRLAVREFSHDSTFTKNGKYIIQCMLFVHEKTADEWINLRKENKNEYFEQKNKLGKIIAERIIAQYPELAGKINLVDAWTPATFERYLNTEHGAYMSFAVTENCIPHKLSEKIPDVENAVMATQWLSSPGGLPIAARKGKNAVDIIVRKSKKHAKSDSDDKYSKRSKLLKPNEAP